HVHTAERRVFLSIDKDHAQEVARPEYGSRQDGPEWMNVDDTIGVLRVGLSVENVDGPSLEGCTCRAALLARRDGILLQECPRLGGGVMSSHDAQHLAVEAKDAGLLCPAQPDTIRGQRVEDRLEIECRAADHLEELARGRLLLPRLYEIAA